MGRKLDALLGRNFKASKFKTLAKLAISRIGILKNQHQVRCTHARSDVIELLNLGHHEQALLRVEHLITEQNMLKEAASTLMFASSRCGEFPELLHIRGVFSSTFGKEFVVRAIELRNNCSVNPKVIQKLSTLRPSLESKLKLLKEIATKKGITLHLEEMAVEVRNLTESANDLPVGKDMDESLSESMKARKKYRDVADAAQEAFVSAAYAAAAARAAVELSRIEPQDFDSPNNAMARSEDLELNEMEETRQTLCRERTVSSSSSDSDADLSGEESDGEKAKEEPHTQHHELSYEITQSDEVNEDESKLGYQSSKLKNTESLEEHLNSRMNKKWVSMRTRRD
ncbi:IST1-like protein [Gossypium australe]|uniref:IST1-like protein n=1 Tax=Gossypium australe TaxID=47621 RepID=A0A5B6VXX6_9ROSI|nr:IST1-like protein [Gossypium australe]